MKLSWNSAPEELNSWRVLQALVLLVTQVELCANVSLLGPPTTHLWSISYIVFCGSREAWANQRSHPSSSWWTKEFLRLTYRKLGELKGSYTTRKLTSRQLHPWRVFWAFMQMSHPSRWFMSCVATQSSLTETWWRLLCPISLLIRWNIERPDWQVSGLTHSSLSLSLCSCLLILSSSVIVNFRVSIFVTCSSGWFEHVSNKFSHQ